MLAPITKSSVPCLMKYSKVIHVDKIDDINKKLNMTKDTTSRYVDTATSSFNINLLIESA